MIELRDYQEEAVAGVLGEWEKGNLNTLLAMSTGSGKTECFLAVLDQDLGWGRALIVAHRQELIYQPRDRILAHWNSLGIPGIVMADSDEYQSKTIIATIQTLSSNGRLDRILAAGPVTHLVTDEAHHSTADTYRALYKAMREHNPILRHVGTTATPRRTDGDPLAGIYDSVAYRFGIKTAIKKKALVPFTAVGVQLPVSLADVREVGEGWDDVETGEVLRARNAEEIVVETWGKYAKDRPTMAFTASVTQAHSLASRFLEYGHEFQALDGTTLKRERIALLRAFQDGTVQGIVNCAVLTEGFDAPHASCLVQVKPTRSDLVYVQMAGRVLRRAPGKSDALILDFVPEDVREMRLAGDLLGVPKEQRKVEEKAEGAGLVLECFGINSAGDGIDGDPDSVIMTVLDYLSSSGLSWTFDGDVASATVGAKDTLAIVMPDRKALDRLEKADALIAADKWESKWNYEYKRVKTKASYRLYSIKGYYAYPWGEFETWEAACDAADDYYLEHGDERLARKRWNWRKREATDKQKALLTKFGLWKEAMTRGKAAQAITHYFARRCLVR